jgi:hypothetical protein
MIATGKVIDNNNEILVGAVIIESDANGNYKTPISKVIISNVNGIFTGDFKPDTFYTASFVGTKKFTFNTKNGIPGTIKLTDDNTLPEIVVESKRTYYWLIPIGLLLLLIAIRQNKL